MLGVDRITFDVDVSARRLTKAVLDFAWGYGPGEFDFRSNVVDDFCLAFEVVHTELRRICTIEIHDLDGHSRLRLVRPWPANDEDVVHYFHIHPDFPVAGVSRSAAMREIYRQREEEYDRLVDIFFEVLRREGIEPVPANSTERKLQENQGQDVLVGVTPSAITELQHWRDALEAATGKQPSQGKAEMWEPTEFLIGPILPGDDYYQLMADANGVTRDVVLRFFRKHGALATDERPTRKGGRPRNSDDDWAYEQVSQGRQQSEVYAEWLIRIGLRAKTLADPQDTFKKAMRARRED